MERTKRKNRRGGAVFAVSIVMFAVAVAAVIFSAVYISSHRPSFPDGAKEHTSFAVGSASYMFGKNGTDSEFYDLSPYADAVSAAEYAVKSLNASRLILALSLADAGEEPHQFYEPDAALEYESTADPESYLAAHGADFARNGEPGALSGADIIDTAASVRDICAAGKTELTVVLVPAFIGEIERYDKSELCRFYSALAKEVDFWDFSLSPLSYDARFFYDASHPRREVGALALGRIDGEDGTYFKSFGSLVTAEGVTAHNESLFSVATPNEDEYTAAVPILMFHHFSDDENGGTIMSADRFESFISALKGAGYSSVTVSDMIEYVTGGKPLPENPVCITIDDGYMSAYENAYPILKKYGMRAVVFPIGSSVGKDTYKETGEPIIPHFGWDEAREMISSGIIELGSHTYDMHQSAQFESVENPRTSALPLTGEDVSSYERALTSDLELYDEILSRELGERFTSLSYPGGYFSTESERIIHSYGITVTLTTREDGKNVLVRSLPSSLYALYRYNVTSNMTPESVLSMLRTYY